jgi:hypothetical protein
LCCFFLYANTMGDTVCNKNVLSFQEILQLFNCAVSQEQAWAILYQLLKEYRHLIEQDFKLLYDQLIINNNNIGIRNVCFRKDGSIYLNLAFRSATANDISKYNDSNGKLLRPTCQVAVTHTSHAQCTNNWIISCFFLRFGSKQTRNQSKS